MAETQRLQCDGESALKRVGRQVADGVEWTIRNALLGSVIALLLHSLLSGIWS